MGTRSVTPAGRFIAEEGRGLQVQLPALPETPPRFQQHTQNQPCTSPARGCSGMREDRVPLQGHGAGLGWGAGYASILSIPPRLVAAPRWRRGARSGTTPWLCPLPSPSLILRLPLRQDELSPPSGAVSAAAAGVENLSPAPQVGTGSAGAMGAMGAVGAGLALAAPGR